LNAAPIDDPTFTAFQIRLQSNINKKRNMCFISKVAIQSKTSQQVVYLRL